MENEEQKENSISPELEACTRERDEYLEGWKRAKADYANYKRDEAERFSAWGKLATEALVTDLLFVLDSLRLGIAAVPEGSAEHTGMGLIRNQLEETLRRYGLQKIAIPPGSPFSPAFQEALGEIDSSHPPGSVAQVMEEGCMFCRNILVAYLFL
jgi:molecular chaperone GrpE